MKTTLRISRILLLTGGLLTLLSLLACDGPFLEGPSSTMKRYNLRFSDGEMSQWEGTRIENTGFCTRIYKGGEVDTIICQPHTITKADPPPADAAPQQAPPSAMPPAKLEAFPR